jgi:hypothetical protein
MRSKRGSDLDKAFKTIQLFNTGRTITAGMLKCKLDVSKKTAYRWLESACLHLPIYEVGRVENKKAGLKPIGYKLLQGTELE